MSGWTGARHAGASVLRRRYGRSPSLYHLVLDASVMQLDPLVELVAAAAEAAWRYDDSRLERDVADVRARLTERPSG